MRLDNKISEDLYLAKNNSIEEQIFELIDKQKNEKNEDFTPKLKILLELAGSFYQCYERLNLEGKTLLTKMLMLELKVNTKKSFK